ncbi:hypothetical protein [Methylorubrum aminovorans]|uniref:hypothetical protein n=1 Tax=Methylorubrum aminovorans TaxID=269069 RepID=UPI003C2D3498
MSSFRYTFNPALPPGRWCVRWIDGFVEHPQTDRDPQLQVTLSAVTDPDWRTLPYLEAIKPRRISSTRKHNARITLDLFQGRIHAGALSSLKLGTVLEAGRPIARLEADNPEFSFDLPSAFVGGANGIFPAHASAAEFLGASDAGNIIPASVFEPYSRKDTLVTVLRGNAGTLLLPQSEVIRAFLAPCSAVARDLVSLPPPYQLRGIIRQGTTITPEGHWRLDLADGIAARHAPMIANLHDRFNARGSIAAAQVFYERQQTNRLAARLPFTDCTLRLKVRVVPLIGNRYLGLEITHVAWPYRGQPQIEVVRWIPERPEDADDQQVPTRRVTTRKGALLDLVSDAGPDFSSDVTPLDAEGIVWSDMPAPQVRELTFRLEPDCTTFPGTTTRTNEVSVGSAAAGTGVADVVINQEPTDSDLRLEGVARFERVVEMLVTLKSDGRIHDWTPLVEPPGGQRASQRGQRAVWKLGVGLKRIPGWCWIVRHPPHRRTLFIVKIELDPERAVLWLEIEPRDRDHVSSSMIVVAGRDLDADELTALVQAVETGEGFGAVRAGEGRPSESVCRRWFHGVSDQPLNAERALKDMKDLWVGLIPTKEVR